jgi:predicted ATP-grasp superfamily ATP-dependent carboligase
MHSSSLANSMDNKAVLIAATSGRALAASARRGGYLPLVTDFFGDQDTVAAAHAHATLCGGFAQGFRERELMEALERLAVHHVPIGIVCGTGFEDRPQLLARLAQRWPLFGNSADKLAMVKDPETFAAVCRDCGMAHPRVSLLRPPEGQGWVGKRRGGSGGHHVAAAAAKECGEDIYYQSLVPGRPVSALLLANGNSAIVLGFSEQWACPTSRQPFRYGGAVQPADIAPRVAERLAESACRLAAALSLTGLNSADFMVDSDDFWILEINPRPGATLDIFEPDGSSLFFFHMAACAGDLIDEAPRLDGAKASAIFYAECDVVAPERFEWPGWSADRPNAGVSIKSGEPVCTVHAGASTAAQARALVDERLASVHTWMQDWTPDRVRTP